MNCVASEFHSQKLGKVGVLLKEEVSWGDRKIKSVEMICLDPKFNFLKLSEQGNLLDGQPNLILRRFS